MISQLAGLVRRYQGFNLVLVDQAMVSGSNFLIGILLARFLGLEAFGLFTLAWIAVLFVQSLQNALIISPMMTIGGRTAPADAERYFGSVFRHQLWFFLASLLLTLTALAIWHLFIHRLPLSTGLALTALITASQWQDFLRRYHFTISQVMSATLGDAVRYLGQVATLLVLVLLAGNQLTLVEALWAKAICSTGGAIVSMATARPRRFCPDTHRSVTREHWAFGKWLAGSTLLYWSSSHVFMLVAAAVLGPVAVGGIRAVETLMGAAHIVFQAMENAIPPRAARTFKAGGEPALTSLVTKLAVGGAATTFALALALSVAPEFWLGLVYGPDFAAYAPLMKWFGLIYILMMVSLVLRIGLRSLERTRPIFASSIITAGIAISLSYPLTAHLGLVGTMIGLVAVPAAGLVVLLAGYMKFSREARRS